jgi:8-oxo-dGTP diphosphatase
MPATDSKSHSAPRPVAAVIGVLAKDEKLLLVRRANPPDAGYWGFPGGKINFGETIAEAAVRELREETGIIAAAGNVLTALDAFDRTEGKIRAHYLLVAVQCRYISGVPVAADDALEARWFSLSEITSGTVQLSRDVERVALLSLEKNKNRAAKGPLADTE